MKKETHLFPAIATCEVCGTSAPCGKKGWTPGQEVILSLTVTVYRRSAGRRQLATSKRVRVCETCLAKIIAERATSTRDGRTLAESLFGRIGDLYNAMCGECSA